MESERAESSLRSLFGDIRFRNDSATLTAYSTSLRGTTVLPFGIVFPISTEEIISLLKLANQHDFKVYPISRGKNFGYGKSQGTEAGQVIVDLSKMNKVVEVNDNLAYATIQPGVSQQQLYDHLLTTNSTLQLDVTGAGLDASIVGNILERGFGHTDYGDRINRIINLTIVTSEGKVIKTGLGDYPNASALNCYRFGIGPMLEGLFSQSNFGIVVEMTMELMPIPEKMCMFIVTTKDENALGNLTTAIKELKLTGVINSAVHFANKARAAGSEKNKMVGAWNMSGAISGHRVLVNARKKVVRKILKQYCPSITLWFIDDTLMSLAGWIYNNINQFSLYPPLKDAYDLQKGIPTDHPLQILFNDNSLNSTSLDIRTSSSCFSWINAVCSADKKDVQLLLNIMQKEFDVAGYEFRITFTAINPRSLIMITNITYPKDDAAIKKAQEFSGHCHAILKENGFLPYRSGSGMYDDLPSRSPDLQHVIDQLKHVFDPNGIVAPGKYNIN